MDDLDRWHALAGEHGVVPAFLIPGEGQETVGALVRCFEEGNGGLRLVIEVDQGVGPQLVIKHSDLQKIVRDPLPPISGS